MRKCIQILISYWYVRVVATSDRVSDCDYVVNAVKGEDRQTAPSPLTRLGLGGTGAWGAAFHVGAATTLASHGISATDKITECHW